MPHVTVEGDELVVRLTGLEVLYALRRRAAVPLTSVRAVDVGPPPRHRGLRAPGTHLPGVVSMGTWRGRFGRELWCVRRTPRALVVELDDAAPFQRLVLEVDDPGAVAASLPLPS